VSDFVYEWSTLQLLCLLYDTEIKRNHIRNLSHRATVVGQTKQTKKYMNKREDVSCNFKINCTITDDKSVLIYIFLQWYYSSVRSLKYLYTAVPRKI
jgi:hypothetical protein